MSKGRPNLEKVKRGVVIHCFDKLTGRNKLPVSVLRDLDENENVNWKMKN